MTDNQGLASVIVAALSEAGFIHSGQEGKGLSDLSLQELLQRFMDASGVVAATLDRLMAEAK